MEAAHYNKVYIWVILMYFQDSVGVYFFELAKKKHGNIEDNEDNMFDLCFLSQNHFLSKSVVALLS